MPLFCHEFITHKRSVSVAIMKFWFSSLLLLASFASNLHPKLSFPTISVYFAIKVLKYTPLNLECVSWVYHCDSAKNPTIQPEYFDLLLIQELTEECGFDLWFQHQSQPYLFLEYPTPSLIFPYKQVATILVKLWLLLFWSPIRILVQAVAKFISALAAY